MKTIHFDLLDSTNTYIKNNYKDLDNFTFVSTDKQTKGRGRENRTWDSDEENLLFSLLLKDSKYNCHINSLSIISAFTVLEVLQEYNISNLMIKWPNDIYADGKKICGILLEAITKENIECLIIGVGINVNQIAFKNGYIHEPTSMKKQLGSNIDIEVLKNKIYDKFNDNLIKLIDGYDYYDEIIKYDYLINKNVYALINDVKKVVRVVGINKDYTLKVELDGSELNINSGEISFHI